MTTATAALAPIAPSDNGLVLVARRAADYANASRAEATRRAYESDWRQFEQWAAARGLCALPASSSTVALYLAGLADTHRVSTIGRKLAAVSVAHQLAGFESPARAAEVRSVMAGIRRALGTAPAAKAPLLTADIRRMVGQLPAGRLGTRDRVLLVLGFAGAFRRSELVGLDVEDVEFTADGAVVTLRRSKTDQEGAGRKVGIPYGSSPETCPVRSLRAWLEVSGIAAGPLFRPVDRHGNIAAARLSDRAVALVVQRHAAACGLNPAKFAGHSLRAGLATSAAQNGVSERAIMRQTGHRSVNTARRYIRDGSLFRENAAAGVGL